MSCTIEHNAYYTREELINILGRSVFEAIQAVGLYAIGGRLYLGRYVLDCSHAAHQNKANQRAATQPKGVQHEKTQVAAHRKDTEVLSAPSGGGAREFLSQMEKKAG